MARVVVKITGQSPRDAEAATVGELKRTLNVPTYAASVNGEPATDDQVLENDWLVTFSPQVKGGC